MFLYLFITNIVSVLIFIIDKKKARKKGERVPKKILHLLELAGGVFGIVLTMYIIRHKNKKASYYLWTFLILVLWCVAMYCLYIDKNWLFNIFK